MVRVILDCSGRQGIQHDEAQIAMQRTGSPCWGWLKTHTYNLRRRYRITKVYVKLKAGPSELKENAPIYIEYSEDGVSWNVLKQVTAPTYLHDPWAEYTIDCDIVASYVRFRTTGSYFVDGSYAELEAEPVGGVAGFNWVWVLLLMLALVFGAVLMVRSRRV